MRKPLKKKGASLVEIIISLAILTIIIVPISNLALTAVKIEKDSGVKLKANALSQQITEYIKDADDGTLSAIDTTLMGSKLGLSSDVDDSIKKNLMEDETGKTKEEFKFYKTDKDCYVKVGIDSSYDAKAAGPKKSDTSIWKEDSFQYRIKIAREKDTNNLNLYDVSDEPDKPKEKLKDTSPIVLNIKNVESKISYELLQGGELMASDDIPQITVGKELNFNLMIEENCPRIIVNIENQDKGNIENQDKVNGLKLFINELAKEDSKTYTQNYKVISKGKIGVYTKVDNQTFSNVKKVCKVEVKIYTCKNGKANLLQNLTNYKYID